MLSLAKPDQNANALVGSASGTLSGHHINLDETIGALRLFFSLLRHHGEADSPISLPTVTNCMTVMRQLGDKYDVPYIGTLLQGYLLARARDDPLKVLALACKLGDLYLAKKAISAFDSNNAT